MNRIMICDDNIEFAKALAEYCDKLEDFELAGMAHDGIEACEKMPIYKPDYLILDIIMPKLDGLGVLERIKDIKLKKYPTIVILSAVGQEHITKRAIDLGAEYFIIKPFDVPTLFDRLRQLKNFQANRSKKRELKKSNSLVDVLDKDASYFVTQIMLELGFPAHINGYNFLRDSILLAIVDNAYVRSITKNLYPKIAAEYNTTPSRVERSIRHAIEVAWLRGNARSFEKLLGHSFETRKNKPTNSEFIATISDKLKIQLKDRN